jgi:hypothetical protein
MRRILISFLATASLVGCGQPSGQADPKVKAERNDRPFLAIWRRDDGFRLSSEAPYLRIAIWNDGRVRFSKDPTKWNHDLAEGTISADRMTQLKQAVVETGVFDLEGYCYLVPDAPCDCLMLDFGDRQQMLYWDEREGSGYGINIAPQPRHVQFKERWKTVNKLALAARPEKFAAVKERFKKPPDSWILKPPIQSE